MGIWPVASWAKKNVCHPDDVKGLQMRAAGKSFNQLLANERIDRVDGFLRDI